MLYIPAITRERLMTSVLTKTATTMTAVIAVAATVPASAPILPPIVDAAVDAALDAALEAAEDAEDDADDDAEEDEADAEEEPPDEPLLSFSPAARREADFLGGSLNVSVGWNCSVCPESASSLTERGLSLLYDIFCSLNLAFEVPSGLLI